MTPWRRGWVLAFAALCGGCPEQSVKQDTGVPPDPEQTNGEVSVDVLDVSGCNGMVPETRSFAQATSFVAPTPFVPPGGAAGEEDWTVDRGMLLYGGKSATGEVLNDLWLLDLTNTDRSCPWILVHGAALPSGGSYGGGLVFRNGNLGSCPAQDPACWSGEFVLVTGFTDDGTGTALPDNDVWVMPQDEIDLGFVYDTDLGGADVTFVRSEDGQCQGLEAERYFCPCFDTGTNSCPVDYWDTDIAVDPCDGLLHGPSGHCADVWLHPACPDGAYCSGELGTHVVNAPGLGNVAVVFDPANDLLELHGGMVGCAGAGCAGAPLVQELIDESNVEAVRSAPISESMAGVAQVTSYGFGGLATELPVGNLPYLPPVWPVEASIGLGRTQGTVLDVAWNPVSREFTSDSLPRTYLVGGRFAQDLPPETTYIVTDMVNLNVGWPYDLMSAEGAEWQEPLRMDDLPTGGDLTGPEMVMRWDGVGYWPVTLDAALPVGSGYAVTRLEPDAFLVTTNPPSIVDFDASFSSAQRIELTTPLGGRFGANAATDPITRTAYVVGGNTPDTVAFAPPYPIVAGAQSAFVTRSVEVTTHLVDVGPVTDWIVETEVALDLVHRCEAPVRSAYPKNLGIASTDPNDERPPTDCFANTVEVLLRGPEVTNNAVEGLTVRVRRDWQEPWRTLDTTFDPATNRITVPLRRTLLDGDSFDLAIAFHQGTAPQATSLGGMSGHLGWQQLVMPFGKWFLGRGLPAQVVMTHGWDPTTAAAGGPDQPPDLQEVVTVAHVAARVPAGTELAVMQNRVECVAVAMDMLAPWVSVDADEVQWCGTGTEEVAAGVWPVGLLQGFTRHPVTTGGHRFQVFVDASLDLGLQGAGGEIVTHWSGGVGGDLADLEGRLGSYVVEDLPVIYLRDPTTSLSGRPTTEGKTFGGALVAVDVFDRITGAALTSQDLWKFVTNHELVHPYTTGPTATEPEARWVEHGMAEGIASEGYYAVLDDARETFDLGALVAEEVALTGPADFSVEDPNVISDPAVDYAVSPYLMEQLVFYARSQGHTAAEVWDALEGMLVDARARADTDSAAFPGPVTDNFGTIRLWKAKIEAGDVAVAAGAVDAQLTWYEQLVTLNRGLAGLPMLGTHSYTPPPVAGNVGSVQVRQIQGDLHNWPLYTDVPFILGCSSSTNLALPSYTQCGLTKVGIVNTTVRTHPGLVADRALTLNLIAGRSRDVWMSLWSNDLLVQDSLPAFFVRDPWLLRCNPGSVAAACVPNAVTDPDGDLFTNLGDCSDNNNAVNPAIFTRAFGIETTSDLNCDQWPR